MAAELVYHRLKYRWLIGTLGAFAIFALVGLYSARMTWDYPTYDDGRDKLRLETRLKVDKTEGALLNPVDDKGNPTATWADQDKNLIQIPIDEAMSHEIADLKNIPVGIGQEIPSLAPAPAPAMTNAAPAAPAPATNAAPAAPAKPAAPGKPGAKPAPKPKAKKPAKPVKTT
jgi:hypothetical protein